MNKKIERYNSHYGETFISQPNEKYYEEIRKRKEHYTNVYDKDFNLTRRINILDSKSNHEMGELQEVAKKGKSKYHFL